ncbi:NlpC/P60 family protein [Robiginitomaculum antarcticum]|uniref:NlpC/P60 family protein n=1 Tax=Robiginitomaculum antarcticum TaxID=437507 RepID=UPI00036073B7|nr:NlpC/P60 family protein [Robiginitomaculum antarcticum]
MTQISRADIVAAARDWIGTPYRHQACCKNAGTDCLGLIRGLWAELYGSLPELPPPYSPDWAERAGRETLYAAAARHMVEKPLSAAKPGDMLLFRMAANSPVKHAAIISAPDKIIHAYWARAVTESFLIPYWQRRRAYAFSFPNLTDPT